MTKPKKTARIIFVTEPELAEAIRKQAFERKTTKGAIIREALKDYFNSFPLDSKKPKPETEPEPEKEEPFKMPDTWNVKFGKKKH